MASRTFTVIFTGLALLALFYASKYGLMPGPGGTTAAAVPAITGPAEGSGLHEQVSAVKMTVLDLEARLWAGQIQNGQSDLAALTGYSKQWLGTQSYKDELFGRIKLLLAAGKVPPLTAEETAELEAVNKKVRALAAPRAEPGPRGGAQAMVSVPGGLVTLEDPTPGSAFPKLAAYLEPYSIDARPTENVSVGYAGDVCAGNSRLPTLAQLQHALTLDNIERGTRLEATSSSINPLDAGELSDLEGVGTMDVYYKRPKVELRLPTQAQAGDSLQARCAVSGEQKPRPPYSLVSETAPRYGPGKDWEEVTGFYGLNGGTQKLSFKKGEELEILYKKDDWALVRHYGRSVTEYPDSGVWLPYALLKKRP